MFLVTKQLFDGIGVMICYEVKKKKKKKGGG